MRPATKLRRNWVHTGLLLVLMVAISASLFSLSAQAAPPPLLHHFCASGTGAGNCGNPLGATVDPVTGNFYIANSENRRVDEFTAYGNFVKAWGWGVVNGSPELQTCTEQSGCRKGLAGTDAGEFGTEGPYGVAVDSSGAVYVYDGSNYRVQKFDTSGPQVSFVLSFGSQGTGPGQFSTTAFGNFITAALGTPDTIYVGDTERIEEFKPDGEYLGNLPDPEGLLTGETVKALAVDSSGSVYFSRSSSNHIESNAKDDVFKLNSTSGVRQCTMKVPRAASISTDSTGQVRVISGLKFVSGGAQLSLAQFAASDCSQTALLSGAELGFTKEAESTAIATSSACGINGVDLLVAGTDLTGATANLFGPPPDPELCPPDSVPPSIDQQFAASVSANSAIVKAQINPHFWPDAHYYVQYGTGECAEGGCKAGRRSRPCGSAAASLMPI